jgi:hypothetical protein
VKDASPKKPATGRKIAAKSPLVSKRAKTVKETFQTEEPVSVYCLYVRPIIANMKYNRQLICSLSEAMLLLRVRRAMPLLEAWIRLRTMTTLSSPSRLEVARRQTILPAK